MAGRPSKPVQELARDPDRADPGKVRFSVSMDTDLAARIDEAAVEAKAVLRVSVTRGEMLTILAEEALAARAKKKARSST